jgi:UDP-N-acetylmuramoyl-tripeptide--D-alanyl-D-alanine ligase
MPDRGDGALLFSPAEMAALTGGTWVGDAGEARIRKFAAAPALVSPGTCLLATSVASWGERWHKSPHRKLHRHLGPDIAALMLERNWYDRHQPEYTVPALIVENTREALKTLARRAREASCARFVQITGTEGKTGFKLFLNHLLQAQARVSADHTTGNQINAVWRNLASIPARDEVAIIEISSTGNSQGTRLSGWVRPHVCVITNTNPSHLRDHKSEEAVPLNKARSVDGLEEGGICIVNRDTSRVGDLIGHIRRRRPDARVVTYSARDAGADAVVTRAAFRDLGWDVEARINGKTVAFRLNRVQEHGPLTLAGVLLAVDVLGFDIEKAAGDVALFGTPFESMGGVHRLRVGQGTFLFYDQHFSITEKALASSLRDVTRIKVPGRKIAVISGEHNSEGFFREVHERIAGYIDETDLDAVFTVGDYMDITVNALEKPDKFHGHFFTIDQLIPRLLPSLRAGDLLFVKGMTKLNFHKLATAVYRHFPEVPQQTPQAPRVG